MCVVLVSEEMGGRVGVYVGGYVSEYVDGCVSGWMSFVVGMDLQLSFIPRRENGYL